MKKKTILNGLMVLIIVLIAFAAVMLVKTLKSPTEEAVSDNQTVSMSISEKKGIITVERSGIAYEVEKDSIARSGDIFRSKKSAQLSLKAANGTLVLGENSELQLEDDMICLERGELFADYRQLESVLLKADDMEVEAKQAVLTVNSHSGTKTIYVYSGAVTVDDTIAEAGQRISLVEKEDGSIDVEVLSFAASALHDTQIKILQNCGMDDSFCFTASELSDVLTLRQEEKSKAQQAQLLLADESKAALEKEKEEYDKALAESQKPQSNTVVTTPSANATVPSTAPTDTTGSNNSSSAAKNPAQPTAKYVTIEIHCDTILDNLGNLTSGKEVYVPGSGTILSTSKIEFTEGETVFDVLKKACNRAGIQLEYRYTPIYESYYIEGINHLYEFDCGDESGWMYKVNGWFPNYGCSSYVLEENDVIVWCYTCNGLGADVGAERF